MTNDKIEFVSKGRQRMAERGIGPLLHDAALIAICFKEGEEMEVFSAFIEWLEVIEWKMKQPQYVDKVDENAARVKAAQPKKEAPHA